MEKPTQAAAHGAYGLRLSGVPGMERSLVRAPAAWPEFTVVIEQGSGGGRVTEHVDAASARVRLRTGGSIDIDREAAVARFTVPVMLSADEIVHPFLAPVAAVSAQWFGRESFHGGGIALGGGAWGVIGDRNGGKSSILAALVARGIDIVSDDVLVVDGTMAFAGPRTVDLRPEAAEVLGGGENIGKAGTRERWRLRLGPVAATFPLAGWVFIGWGDVTDIRRLPASETLPRLLQHRGITIPPADPAAFLYLSALPAWEFRRPRTWDAMPAALDRLLDVLATS
jgi:hypothetical protein